MAEAAACVEIRPLTAADATDFRALRLAALADAPEAFGASHADEAGQPLAVFAGRLAGEPPSRVFGAFLGGALVGMAGFRPATGAKSRHRATLWGVYVAPAGRKRGLGEALVSAAIAYAQEHVLIVQARVVTANRAAYALYLRLGFRPYGVEAKALRLGDVFYDEALLALDFSEQMAPPRLAGAAHTDS